MPVSDDELSSELLKVLAERGQAQSAAGLASVMGVLEEALVETLPPKPPPPTVLSSLMQKVQGEDRITFFAPLLASLFDLSLEAAQKLCVEVRDDSAWVEGPGPGVKLLPISGGPKIAGSLAALVRLEPGIEFPSHPHLGVEQVLLLEGGYIDSTGAEYWRGELHVSQASSEHSFRAAGGIPCICAALHAISPANP